MEQLRPDIWLLTNAFDSNRLLPLIRQIEAAAPFRHLQVKSGKSMSVAMTNCGEVGWYLDKAGYRYQAIDPQTRKPWPAMPSQFKDLAIALAAQAGWANFNPDACLVNRYDLGAKMGLHQDQDEQDFRQPIVSLSIGASCQFLIGGLQRKDPVYKMQLHDGDALVWGNAARRVFHGVESVFPTAVSSMANGTTTDLRFNLTFRKAL